MKFAAKSKERRGEVRYSMSGELPARLSIQGQQQNLEYVLVDVSPKGLGLLLSPSPAAGSLLELVFDDGSESIVFYLRYTRPLMDSPIPGLESTFRCGCELHENLQGKINLVEYFARFPSVMIGE